MEVALDFALQCAPDHPWVSQHPEWFTTKPDGTIAYAENPPKKYQDIYPLNFDNDPEGLYAEIRRVLKVWVDRGVRDLQGRQPAHEATELLASADLGHQGDRPRRAVPCRGLHPPGHDAHAGKARVHPVLHLLHVAHRQMGTGGVRAPAREHCPTTCGPISSSTLRTSCTPACNTGGPTMFKIRAVLAAMMSPSWGVYSGYELFEFVPLRPAARSTSTPRNTSCGRATSLAEPRADSLAPFLARLNDIRRAHPALQQLRTCTSTTSTTRRCSPSPSGSATTRSGDRDAGSARNPGGHDGSGHAGSGTGMERTLRRARSDLRRDVRLGTGELRPPGPA